MGSKKKKDDAPKPPKPPKVGKLFHDSAGKLRAPTDPRRARRAVNANSPLGRALARRRGGKGDGGLRGPLQRSSRNARRAPLTNPGKEASHSEKVAYRNARAARARSNKVSQDKVDQYKADLKAYKTASRAISSSISAAQENKRAQQGIKRRTGLTRQGQLAGRRSSVNIQDNDTTGGSLG